MTYTEAGWLNTLNPFVLQFSEHFGIRWYGLAYVFGFFITFLLARIVARRRSWPNAAILAGDFVFYAALGTVIGGRLGYCLLYDPSLLFRFSDEFPFWGVLMIHRGGMASHGGILALFLTCVWFARLHKLSMWSLMDIVSMAGCVGIFAGRIANFINGELVGRPVTDTHAWAVRFPQDLLQLPPSATTWRALGPAASQVGVPPEQWDHIVARGQPGALYQAAEKIISELQRGNQVLAETVAPLLTARYPSQLYEALLEGLVLGICCAAAWARARFDGAAVTMFLLVYPWMRIIGEQYRMPDPQIGFEWLGLTRGQWLSAVMFLCALGVYAYWRRARQLPPSHCSSSPRATLEGGNAQ